MRGDHWRAWLGILAFICSTVHPLAPPSKVIPADQPPRSSQKWQRIIRRWFHERRGEAQAAAENSRSWRSIQTGGWLGRLGVLHTERKKVHKTHNDSQQKTNAKTETMRACDDNEEQTSVCQPVFDLRLRSCMYRLLPADFCGRALNS